MRRRYVFAQQSGLRMRLSKIKQGDYKLFIENDCELASKYGKDISFLKRNNAEFS